MKGYSFGPQFQLKMSLDVRVRLRIRPSERNLTSEGKVPGPLSSDALASLAKQAGAGSLSSPFAAVGKSGVKHTFTFGTKAGGKTKIVCDMVSGTAPVDETKVLSLFIKVYDVGAAHALLCATPSLSADARKLAGIYNMTVVEAADKDSAVKKVADVLRRIDKQT